MVRRKNGAGSSLVEMVSTLKDKLRPPLGVILGSPREAAELVGAIQPLFTGEIICYQMDLYQAERLREELGERGLTASVVTLPDLWDLPEPLQGLVYAIPQGGERMLKLDMLEQAFHVLRPHGRLVVFSPYEKDELIPAALKKIFGRVHTPGNAVFWAQRDGERRRRRHEVTFQVSRGELSSLRFLSRPGVFSYGRFDDGARALVETTEVNPGEEILDIGCGCGTNGVCVGMRAGPDAHVAFLDSNVRAIALAEHNARANGLTSFETVATSRVDGVPEGNFDVVLANPPYYAQLNIARLFIERAAVLLRPGGRLSLVTKQPDQVGPIMADHFGMTEVAERRGYTILCTRRPDASRIRE